MSHVPMSEPEKTACYANEPITQELAAEGQARRERERQRAIWKEGDALEQSCCRSHMGGEVWRRNVPSPQPECVRYALFAVRVPVCVSCRSACLVVFLL